MIIIFEIARPLGMHYNHYVSPFVRYQSEKILITLETYGIFGSHFAYLFILILPSHCYAKRWLGFAETFYFEQSLVIYLHTFLGEEHSQRFAYLCLDNVKLY